MTDLDKAKELIEGKFACVQTAPSIRVALGEAFGLAPGEMVEGKVVAALHQLGFKRVFETDFGAELRVMEESKELKERLESGENMPMMTSCCPSWAGICVKMYPELIPHLSTCKSPMEMVSSFAKDYLTHERRFGDITVTAVMPCFAKKMEVKHGQTDLVITAMELYKWMQEEGIDLKELKDGFYDTPLGMTTAAGTIYASTGGVMEATLRTFSAMYGNSCDTHEHLYEEKIIGEGIREKDVRCGEFNLKVAMVEGGKGIHEFCKGLKEGKYKDYHMVEMMFCSGGCVGGPGMPNAGKPEAIRERIRSLKHYDDNSVLHSAHENPFIKQIYKDYLMEPFGKKSKEVLHVKDFNVMFG